MTVASPEHLCVRHSFMANVPAEKVVAISQAIAMAAPQHRILDINIRVFIIVFLSAENGETSDTLFHSRWIVWKYRYDNYNHTSTHTYTCMHVC